MSKRIEMESDNRIKRSAPYKAEHLSRLSPFSCSTSACKILTLHNNILLCRDERAYYKNVTHLPRTGPFSVVFHFFISSCWADNFSLTPFPHIVLYLFVLLLLQFFSCQHKQRRSVAFSLAANIFILEDNDDDFFCASCY